MDKTMTVRFSLYVFLILGIILSLWLSENSRAVSTRIAVFCSIALFMMPNLRESYWETNIDTPAFFARHMYVRYLAPNDNIIILPFGIRGNSDTWQATSDCYFRMAGGYVGISLVPASFEPYVRLLYSFDNPTDFPLSGEFLKAFLIENHISAIVLADQQPHFWTSNASPGPFFPELEALNQEQIQVFRSLFGKLKVTPIKVGGILLYRVPLEKLGA
jgi:hypothetical protein